MRTVIFLGFVVDVVSEDEGLDKEVRRTKENDS